MFLHSKNYKKLPEHIAALEALTCCDRAAGGIKYTSSSSEEMEAASSGTAKTCAVSHSKENSVLNSKEKSVKKVALSANASQRIVSFVESVDEGYKKNYDRFPGQVRDIAAKLNACKDINMIALLKFLRDWLKEHIQGTNRKHSAFMNNHGLR